MGTPGCGGRECLEDVWLGLCGCPQSPSLTLIPGWSLEPGESALEKFRKVAQEHGFKEPDFHLLKRDSEWPSPRSSPPGKGTLGLPPLTACCHCVLSPAACVVVLQMSP